MAQSVLSIDLKLTCLLGRLLREGYLADPERQLLPLLQGIAHPAAEGGWIVSERMLCVYGALAGDAEGVAALLALLPTVRESWLRIVAARCTEAAQMRESQSLVSLVTQLSAAAAWVEAVLDDAALAPTPYAAVERELLGVSAEQAAATPMLARVLLATAQLGGLEGQARLQPLPVLPTVDLSGVQADRNWRSGRLLALPNSGEASGSACADYLLVGAGERATERGRMEWALANPWALLLTMVTYAQDIWAAEARGGLLLELPGGQSAYQPAGVAVLVQTADGAEQTCGALGALLLRALSHLGLSCFPRLPDPQTLDGLLAPLVGELLRRQIWRYRDGVSGSSGQYQIHPDFADECYRLPAARVFNRTGKHLWQAIRIQAERWRDERCAPVTMGAIR